MIRNKLAELLAERNLKISRVANDIPDLSRNTINSISNNKTKMIQMNTVDLLCQYLNITPCDFFDYKPYDVNVKSNINDDFHVISEDSILHEVYLENIKLEIFLNTRYVRENNTQFGNTFELIAIPIFRRSQLPVSFSKEEADDIREQYDSLCMGGYSPDFDPDNFDKDNINLTLEVMLNNESDKKMKNKFKIIWDDLGAGFQAILKEDILSSISSNINSLVNKIMINENLKIDLTRLNIDLNFTFNDVSNFDYLDGGYGSN